jgi:hypothetical protein
MLIADFILSAKTMNLDGPAVVMGAKTYDVYLGHRDAKIARKRARGKA